MLNIGNHYVSDFVKSPNDWKNRQKYNLDLYLDSDIGAARLIDVAPPESMWGQYWYRSGINSSMTQELKNIVSEITSRVKLNSGDIWLDIACNDGTLLKAVPDNLIKVGIDPADDSYLAESSKVATVIQDYFNYGSWQKADLGGKTAKVITCIAMFYDLDNPGPFIQDLEKVLDDNGLLVLQMSYTPLMVKQLAFDNICHEHVYYYDLKSIQKLFGRYGFKIVDCSLNDTNGGSFRIYLQKQHAKVESFSTAPMRDVAQMRVESLINYETNILDISNPNTWENFSHRLEKLKSDVVDFIKQANQLGKKVYGYGASTKGNTLLQYFGLNHNDIIAIAERSSYKFGLKTIGTNIPIVSEDEMRQAKPDYLLMLPWHFISEFTQREKDFLEQGGKFIVPCPSFRIISK